MYKPRPVYLVVFNVQRSALATAGAKPRLSVRVFLTGPIDLMTAVKLTGFRCNTCVSFIRCFYHRYRCESDVLPLPQPVVCVYAGEP